MKTNKIIVRLVVTLALMLNTACNSSSGLASVSLKLSDGQTVANSNIFSLLFPKAKAANFGDILFCLERLRFKLPEDMVVEVPGISDDSSEIEIEDSIDFELGEVAIDPQGTDLGDLQVPVGTYSRIEFDLDTDCMSGKSLQVTNINGTYSTNQEVTIKFDGNFVVSDGVQITLPLADMVSALDSFNPSSNNQQVIDEELEDLMESLSIRISDDN